MKLSDCPFAVGTPEHSAWVRTVYIPQREVQVANCSTPQPGSAASVGRKFIDGRVEDQRLTKTLMAKLIGRPAPEQATRFEDPERGRRDIGIIRDPEATRTNDYKFFFEEFKGISVEELAAVPRGVLIIPEELK